MPLCSPLPSGNAVALVIHVLIDTTHVRVTTVAFNDDAVVHSHTYTHDVVFPIKSQILEPIHTPLHVRVVGDQDAIHVLSVSVTALNLPLRFPSVCVSHNNAEFLQISLGLVLRLVDHPINFGKRQFLHHDTLDDRGLDSVVCGL